MNASADDLLKPLRGMYLAQLRERAASVEAFLGHCRAGAVPGDESLLMKELAHKRRASFKATLNDVLRKGLAPQHDAPPPPRFEVKPHSGGFRPGIAKPILGSWATRPCSGFSE